MNTWQHLHVDKLYMNINVNDETEDIHEEMSVLQMMKFKCHGKIGIINNLNNLSNCGDLKCLGHLLLSHVSLQ